MYDTDHVQFERLADELVRRGGWRLRLWPRRTIERVLLCCVRAWPAYEVWPTASFASVFTDRVTVLYRQQNPLASWFLIALIQTIVQLLLKWVAELQAPRNRLLGQLRDGLA